MRTLLEHDGITQRELTHLMASDPNTVASLLERMEKADLLERRAHEKDRRAYRLHLKTVGKRKYEAARIIAVALQAEILSVLPAEDREKFLCQLAQIADACQNSANQAPK
jgi:DNA-binding MarR family transcriptional regulator